jgi:hypothetical protein
LWGFLVSLGVLEVAWGSVSCGCESHIGKFHRVWVPAFLRLCWARFAVKLQVWGSCCWIHVSPFTSWPRVFLFFLVLALGEIIPFSSPGLRILA